VKVVLEPAASEYGTVIPLMLNPAPLAVTLVILSVAVPEFVTVTVCFALLPTLTEPNEMLVGLTLKEEVPAAPVPLRGIARGEVGALLAREIEPEKADPDFGANVASNDADWPAGIVSGVTSPDALKSVPLMLN
jgi:hypothetical protein